MSEARVVGENSIVLMISAIFDDDLCANVVFCFVRITYDDSECRKDDAIFLPVTARTECFTITIIDTKHPARKC